jgi:hypothetical protein
MIITPSPFANHSIKIKIGRNMEGEEVNIFVNTVDHNTILKNKLNTEGTC